MAQEEQLVTADGGTIARDEVRARVTTHAPNVIRVLELAGGTESTWRAMVDGVHEEAAGAERWGLIIDLDEVKARPKGAYKEAITETLSTVDAAHIAIVQPGNALLRSVLRFLVTRESDRISVHKTLEAAADAVNQALLVASGE